MVDPIPVPARVSSEIVIRLDDLDQALKTAICASLTVANEEKEKALALKLWGSWELPDVIKLYREETRRGGDRVLCLPRGFAAQLSAGAAQMGYQIVWDDQRSRCPAIPGYFVPFTLRDYQLRAVMEMLKAEQGVYEAAAGSGKTTTALGLMAFAQQRTVVITDKAFLLEQWRERAAQFLGLSLDLDDERSVGKIGEDVWEERDLTICLRQTLFSRLWETKATKWFSRVGLVFLDESHAAGSAETLQEVIKDISSAMVFGLSATPARTEMQAQVVGAVLGPIVARTTRQELYDRNVLVRPTLEVVKTDLQVTHWKTHDSTSDGTCDDPKCKKDYPHGHRDNWQSCLKALVDDEDRNRLIARTIVSQRGHVHLVPSKQLKHLNLIKRALEAEGWDGPIYLLRGEENARGESQKIVRAIEAGGFWEPPPEARKVTKAKIAKLKAAAEEAGEEFLDPNERPWVQVAPIGEHGHEAVILSTVAGEGFDVPMIDREHIVYPIRQRAAHIQLIGRCERDAPNKFDAILYDYDDYLSNLFHDQHQSRRQTYYLQGIQEQSYAREAA